MTDLTKAESAWLEQRHAQADREAREAPGPSRSMADRLDMLTGLVLLTIAQHPHPRWLTITLVVLAAVWLVPALWRQTRPKEDRR